MLYETEGIVLSDTAYGEYDKFITVFTEEQGMVEGSIKGARRPNSKLAPLTQPFCRGVFQLYRGKNAHRVTQVMLKTSYPEIRSQYDKTVYARYLAELVMELIPPHEKVPDQYSLFVYAMDTLAQRRDPWPVAKWAELTLLSNAGYAPTLNVCVICQGALTDPTYFSSGLGGVVCKNCLDEIPTWDERLSISLGAVKTLEFLTWNKRNCPHINARGRVRDDVNSVLRTFTSSVLSRRLRSSFLVENIEKMNSHKE